MSLFGYIPDRGHLNMCQDFVTQLEVLLLYKSVLPLPYYEKSIKFNLLKCINLLKESFKKYKFEATSLVL